MDQSCPKDLICENAAAVYDHSLIHKLHASWRIRWVSQTAALLLVQLPPLLEMV